MKNYSFNEMETFTFKEDFGMNDGGLVKTFFKIALGVKLGVEVGGFISVFTMRLLNTALDNIPGKYLEQVKKSSVYSNPNDQSKKSKRTIGFRCE